MLRNRQEGRPGVLGGIQRLAGNPSEIDQVASGIDVVPVAGRDQRVQVGHLAVLPEEAATAGETRGAGDSNHLPPVVDPESLADRIAWERTEIPDAASFGPQERARVERAAVAGGDVGESHYVTPFVDGHGRVPSDTSEVANVDDRASVPEHRVSGAEPT